MFTGNVHKPKFLEQTYQKLRLLKWQTHAQSDGKMDPLMNFHYCHLISLLDFNNYSFT